MKITGRPGMDLLFDRLHQPDRELTEHEQRTVEHAQSLHPRALLLSWKNDPDPVRRAMARRAEEIHMDQRNDR